MDDRIHRDQVIDSELGFRNPADVADITALAETTALYRRRIGAAGALEITSEIIERSIRRVIVTPA